MPIYEYRCTECGDLIEELQKPDDPPPVSNTVCPVSGNHKHERVMSVCTQKWTGEASSEGRGGWQRNGDAVYRQVPGGNTERYGEGSV